MKYTYSHKEGGWGVELNQREGREDQQFTKILYLQSINSDKQMPQSLYEGHFFR
jgi:hypothetical protein